MRIEMEGLNKPDDDHDSSVLNPQTVNEADLTLKERRHLEKEKLKDMCFKKKLEYIWMYYKPAMAAVLALIVLGKVGVDWYHNFRTDTVLAISAVDTINAETENAAESIKMLLGYGDDEYSKVEIMTNLTTVNSASEFEYNAQMVYATFIQAGTLDVLVFPERLYERANSGGKIFANLKELLDEETKTRLGNQLKADYVAFDDKEILEEEWGLYYEPVCIAVPLNAKNPENAAKWIASLVEG